MKYKSIILKSGKEESVRRFHPWIFTGAIARQDNQIEEGDFVNVWTRDGDCLGVGLAEKGSSIACRLLAFGQDRLPQDFLEQSIKEAYDARLSIGLACNPETDCYRLVHGEGDCLPGLVVDIYGSTAVVQAHTVGMHRLRNQVAQAVVKVVPEVENVYYKSEGTLPYKADIKDRQDGYLIGGETNCIAKENSLLFRIDWLRGQKTGFFLDQRENRSLVERYSKGKRVLNMCCYTGGFSVYALRGGAVAVDSVDSSEKAIELTQSNIDLNFNDETRHRGFCKDAFEFLAEAKKDEYDLIILDPPAFAKHRSAIKNALQGYKRLNARAIEKIKKGGLLFTFSCSQAVDKEMFRLAVFSAAAMTGRKVRILHQLHQPQDHPINIYHPEGEYLKGLVLQIS